MLKDKKEDQETVNNYVGWLRGASSAFGLDVTCKSLSGQPQHIQDAVYAQVPEDWIEEKGKFLLSVALPDPNTILKKHINMRDAAIAKGDSYAVSFHDKQIARLEEELKFERETKKKNA